MVLNRGTRAGKPGALKGASRSRVRATFPLCSGALPLGVKASAERCGKIARLSVSSHWGKAEFPPLWDGTKRYWDGHGGVRVAAPLPAQLGLAWEFSKGTSFGRPVPRCSSSYCRCRASCGWHSPCASSTS
ncbi:protein of unknown function [Hyphomicrobium sp. 1Nfss2.1]